MNKSGINFNAAVSKYLSNLASFKSEALFSDAAGEYVYGRYENLPGNYVVFADKSIRIMNNEGERIILLQDIINASVPGLSQPGFKNAIAQDPYLRIIELTLSNGQSVPVLIMNNSENFVDLFPVADFFRKVAFFERKRREKI